MMPLKVALRLGRISNLPTVLTNVLAGFALARPGGAASLPGGALTFASLGAVLAYVGGMYLNDAFDRDFDRVMRPERPIPSGEVTARLVFSIGFALLALALGCFALAGALGAGGPLRTALSGMLLLATIVAYDAFHKANPLAPGLMGACRGLVYLTAASAVADPLSVEVQVAAVSSTLYVVGLTSIARRENDRVFIRPWATVLLAAPIAGLFAPSGAPSMGLIHPIVFATLAAFVFWVAWALLFLRRTPPVVPATVIRLIAGISLIDALFIAEAGRPGLALVAVLGAVATRGLQRFIPGT